MPFICPCCGYAGLTVRPYAELDDLTALQGLTPPYSRFLGAPSYDVCDCCGFEFGNDDEPGTGNAVSFERYRSDWQEEGCPWFAPERRPEGWCLADQLARAGIPAL